MATTSDQNRVTLQRYDAEAVFTWAIRGLAAYAVTGDVRPIDEDVLAVKALAEKLDRVRRKRVRRDRRLADDAPVKLERSAVNEWRDVVG
jgi:hypothetical protein